MSARERRRPHVVIEQAVIPDYRQRFFEALFERLGDELVLVSGDEDWEPGIRNVDQLPRIRVRNVFLARRRLLWQWGAVRPLLAADVAVLDLNPRIASSWVALLGRRLRRRRSLLWGHAWPRKGPASRTEHVRRLMRRLADTVVVYTGAEASQLVATDAGIDVVAAENALYRRDELRPTTTRAVRSDLVCVGRLTEAKRPDLLLEGFLEARATLPPDVRLVFVGDGPLRTELEERARRTHADDRVVFTGHLSTIDELRAVYDGAIASVSPGYAGLSVIQSLGFGVPMIVASDADHAPEIEAAVDGENAVFFAPSSPEALAAAIAGVVRDRERWRKRQPAIAESVARYTIETMVDSFLLALAPRSTRQRKDDPGPGARR